MLESRDSRYLVHKVLELLIAKLILGLSELCCKRGRRHLGVSSQHAGNVRHVKGRKPLVRIGFESIDIVVIQNVLARFDEVGL